MCRSSPPTRMRYAGRREQKKCPPEGGNDTRQLEARVSGASGVCVHLIDHRHDDDWGGSVDLVCSDGTSVLRARSAFSVSRTP